MHATVTAHKGILVLELLVSASILGEVTTSMDNPTCIGQVIHDTANNLGVSKEALKLLKTVKTSNDDLGDVDWFATSDGKASFGWLGGPRALIDAASAEGSSSYGIFGCKIIPKDVPEAVVQLLADRII